MQEVVVSRYAKRFNNNFEATHCTSLVDATKSSWASPPKQTDCASVFKFNCFKAAGNTVNLAHVNGTKAKSTLTCTQIPANPTIIEERLKGMGLVLAHILPALGS